MKNQKRFRLAFVGLILLAALQTTANASMISIGYTFDGTSMNLTNGPSLFTQSMSVGDIIELTYKADGAASYWDFSGVSTVFGTNLGFLSDSYATRASQGFYEAKLDGATVLYNPFYTSPYQSSVHLGPNHVDYSGVTALDEFTISYELLSTTNLSNNIGSYDGLSNSWQVWDLFGLTYDHGASFVHAPDVVPEPTSFAIWALGMICMGTTLRRRRTT